MTYSTRRRVILDGVSNGLSREEINQKLAEKHLRTKARHARETRAVQGKSFDLSRETIRKVERIGQAAQSGNVEAKTLQPALGAGTISINAAYKRIFGAAKKPLFVTIDPDLHAELKSAAMLGACTMSEFIETALHAYLAGSQSEEEENG